MLFLAVISQILMAIKALPATLMAAEILLLLAMNGLYVAAQLAGPTERFVAARLAARMRQSARVLAQVCAQLRMLGEAQSAALMRAGIGLVLFVEQLMAAQVLRGEKGFVATRMVTGEGLDPLVR